MTPQEAKNILDSCDRHELRDHAFGDREISWTRRGLEVAFGYSDGSTCGVHLVGGEAYEGEDAKMLVDAGTLRHAERNDEAGPTDFVEGRIMPGLTKQAVRQEIEMQRFFKERKTSDYN